MITLSIFKEMLQVLGFKEEKKGVFSKSTAADWTISLKVDFNNRQLIYPDEIDTGDHTTCNFSKDENFVVFECICALLDKGYRPEHIAIEKRWKLGHEEKSGKADICIADPNGKTLLIIECKTYGQEYSKERKQMLVDGGQLFSYWQQEGSTQWLALYASDFKDRQVIRECEVIRSVDDKNVIELAKKDDSYRLYANAHTAAELFEAWDETYGKAFLPDVIFSKDSKAYEIGIRPLRSSDLKNFRAEDKIVNRFEEILRHNNVSDKENAFNRLTALFICKLVDEINHANDDDELEFQYKQGSDTYETLQDRLQKLHQKGMQDFMRETIFYIANDYPEKLMAQYAKQKRQAMIEDLRKTIRILKFYSNNDFSFKDVHNEELFLQNGKVLVEVVQLFERYRIVYNSKEQFLGDLFEQLLNKGFKQNEGQFFTPMPITRFIWDSLPLEKVIHNSGKYNLPKVIDFACGAGHFLTEAVEAVNAYLDHTNQPELKKDNAWVEKSIYGIEKDYRLARVSKISLFMNGAGYGNIIFGDGLDNYPDKGIEPGTFDILVANPPYSVSAFKQHFKPKNNKLELVEQITNTGSEIEVLFVERISQLLKPKGLAAVILPASILSNSSASYIGARESLLENFKIRAIVQFGSKTFGATGTNTIVAFLEKYDEPPKRKELVKDSANAIQSNAEITDWEDQQILDAYLVKIEVSAEDYRKFCAKDQNVDVWYQHPYFGQYLKAAEMLPEIRKKKAQKTFQSLSKEKQNEILQAEFYKYVFACEQEKLRFFALVYNQTTLVVTAPSDNDDQKEFLGYDWSNRKGAEGIQILNPGGKLFCDTDRYAKDNASAMIRAAFTTPDAVPAGLEKYCAWHGLQDMIDFSRVEFNKEIKVFLKNIRKIKSKYLLVRLGDYSTIRGGNTFAKRYQGNKNIEDYPFYKVGDMNSVGNEIYMKQAENYVSSTVLRNEIKGALFLKGTIIFPKVGMAISTNKKRILSRDAAVDNNVMGITCENSGILSKYLYEYLCCRVDLIDIASKSNPPSISATELSQYEFPLPPLDIQQKIVDECSAVESAFGEARKVILNCQMLIESFVDSVFDAQYPMQSIGSVSDSVEYGSSAKSSKSGKVAVVRMGNVQNGRIDWSDLVYSNDDEEISKYELRKYDVLFNRTNSPELVGKSCIYLGEQSAIFAGYLIRVNYKQDVINPFYLCYMLNSKRVREHGFSVMSKSVNQANINGSLLKQYQIPLPPMKDQQALVDKILKKESAITEAQSVLDTAITKKQAILDKWL